MSRNLFKELKMKRVFNADNCFNKQEKSRVADQKAQELFEKKVFEAKVDEIKGRIEFVVENSLDQHAVIYIIGKKEEGLYQEVGDYFYHLGFRVIFTKIEGVAQTVMVITWG